MRPSDQLGILVWVAVGALVGAVLGQCGIGGGTLAVVAEPLSPVRNNASLLLGSCGAGLGAVIGTLMVIASRTGRR